MANNITPEYLRGFLVPLALGSDNVWDAQSSFTTADERAGDPVPQQNSAMQLIAKGRQSGASDLTIKTQSPGFAGQPSDETHKTHCPDFRICNSLLCPQRSTNLLQLWIQEKEIFLSHTLRIQRQHIKSSSIRGHKMIRIQVQPYTARAQP